MQTAANPIRPPGHDDGYGGNTNTRVMQAHACEMFDVITAVTTAAWRAVRLWMAATNGRTARRGLCTCRRKTCQPLGFSCSSSDATLDIVTLRGKWICRWLIRFFRRPCQSSPAQARDFLKLRGG